MDVKTGMEAAHKSTKSLWIGTLKPQTTDGFKKGGFMDMSFVLMGLGFMMLSSLLLQRFSYRRVHVKEKIK
ncbi:MAG TPA: hypothetical protein VKY27_10215 [Bacteriovoracaceae bacterium]|nr:hypothetical protein [Bacteriovoracaceae bacterium]